MKKFLYIFLALFFLVTNCYAITSVVTTNNFNMIFNVPVSGTLTATNNINFGTIGQGVIEANGTITINVFYNDLVSANQVSLVAYSDGLVGQQIATVVPISIKIVGQTYTVLDSGGDIMKNWNAPYTQAVVDTVVLKISADFSKLIKQQYACTIAFNLNKN